MARSRSRRRWSLLAVALLVAGAAGTLHLAGANGRSAESGRLSVSQGSFEPPGLYVSGATLTGAQVKGGPSQGRGQQLAERASAPLIGADAPVAVASRDRTSVAVNTWRWTKTIDWARSLADQGVSAGDPLGIPQLRIQDTLTGKDRPLEAGSMSAAWRSDGALAYSRGYAVYRADTPYLRDVVVRATPTAPAETWSAKADRFTVLAWAGPALLAKLDVPGASPSLVALDGPGKMRVLAERASFVALSPDGKSVLVSVGPADTPEPLLKAVDVASGATSASLGLADLVDPVDDKPVQWATGRGSWIDGHVVVPTSTGLAVLDAGGRLSVSQVLHLDSAARPNGVLYEPHFLDDSARQIVTWQDVPDESTPLSVQLMCDRIARACIRTTPVPATEAARPVDDESRGAR